MVFFNSSNFAFQDLKNLRTQLYSAAEYFELSYTNDDQKQMWVTLITADNFKFLLRK